MLRDAAYCAGIVKPSGGSSLLLFGAGRTPSLYGIEPGCGLEEERSRTSGWTHPIWKAHPSSEGQDIVMRRASPVLVM